MRVEAVVVDIRSRAAEAAGLKTALELGEYADVRAEVQVAVEQVTLEQVVIVPEFVLRPATEIGVVIGLEAGPCCTADRQVVAVPLTERDVLQDVQSIG